MADRNFVPLHRGAPEPWHRLPPLPLRVRIRRAAAIILLLGAASFFLGAVTAFIMWLGQ